MRTFLVQKGENGMPLQKYLEKIFSGQPASVVYKSLRKKKIKVNEKRITDGKHLLRQGDRIDMYVSDIFFGESPKERYVWKQLRPDIHVVYEDEHILLLNKPSGLLSQSETEDSLEGRMRAYLYKKGEIPQKDPYVFLPSLCHRIDRNTEGLLLAAKDAESQRILHQKIREREIKKFYLCQLTRRPEKMDGILAGYIQKDTKHQKMRFQKEKMPGGVWCETAYHVWTQGEKVMAEIELLTGKTHQIRASFAAIGCPLVGDVKYGAPRDGKCRYQHLLAYKLVFSFSSPGGMLSYLDGKVFQMDKRRWIKAPGETISWNIT